MIWRNGMYNGVKLVAFICSSIPVMLFYTWRVCRVCDLFVARNVSRMSLKISTQTEQIYVFTIIKEAEEARVWIP